MVSIKELSEEDIKIKYITPAIQNLIGIFKLK